VSNPPIQAVVEAGGGPAQSYKATRAAINLLAGSSKQTTKVFKHNCISTLVDIVNFDKSWTEEKQALWVLANATADSALWCDKVLEAGGLEAVLTHPQDLSRSCTELACTVVSNIFRRSPTPALPYQLQALPFLLAHFKSENSVLISQNSYSYHPGKHRKL